MTFVLPVIALLIVLGSWRGWRRSPLYSVRITLQMIGATVLIASVVMGFSLAIFEGPVSHSPVAQGILGVTGFLLLSIGAMILLIRITDSHVAQLPPAVHLQTLHRRKVQRWIWRFLVYVLITAVACLVVPADWVWLPSLLGGFPLLVCGPLLAIFYMMARRNDRGLTTVLAAPWVHWQYPPVQWAAWAKNQQAWERSQGTAKTTWRAMLMLAVMCAALFSLGAWMTGGGFRENAVIVAGLVAFVVLFFGTLFWFDLRVPDRHYRRIAAARPEAYFGDEGFFCNGEYTPWILSGQYLVEASAASDAPPRLTLVFQSFNGSDLRLLTKRVPLPEEGPPDLPLLQRKLAARCPKAAVRVAARS